MFDPFDRRISYLRLSVTDRCNLRCRYCLGQDVTFVPRSELMSLEEIERLCAVFIRLGVRKLRLTGGEPLVRRGVVGLVGRLGRHLAEGRVDELTLTTNGTHLARHADELHAAGVRRINVSLDTLSDEVFRRITRLGSLAPVLDGILAAQRAGLAVKINTVALKGINEDGIDRLIGWCGEQGLDMALIEVMPLGDVGTAREDQYLPLTVVRRRLERRWTLLADSYRSGGPARYVTVAETGRRLGFITPMTHGFCGGCNRVRVTAGGLLHPCLGHERGIDLLGPMRSGEADLAVEQAILRAIGEKPRGHDFLLGRPVPARRMNVTGG